MASIVLVHGDTTTAFSAASVSFYLGILVVHVEAGLTIGNKNAPEMNRQLIARIADVHFAPNAKKIAFLRGRIKWEHMGKTDLKI